MNNACKYENQQCWFRHETRTNISNIEKEEVTEKIFRMMETFTQRILNLEENLNLKQINVIYKVTVMFK